jgi:predicted  nucleic acid-binding Zn-ribbon protein
MADAGPNYNVERKRLMLQKLEHDNTIQKGRARIAEIERQKTLNLERAGLQNDELDGEIDLIEQNEASLRESIANIEKNAKAMIAPKE